MRFERVFVTAIFVLAFVGLASGAMAQTKPVPLINQPLVPDAVAPGGPAFTLTVNGTGFVNKSVVEWNGGKRTTTVVSHSQLTATISAHDIATAGTASVTVVNPAPTGGRSNLAFLSVTNPTTAVGFRLAASPGTGRNPFAVAVGDFNMDGNLDLAVVNQNTPQSTVSILLGDGTGNFILASSPQTGGDSDSVAVGDFNGDGKLDLAVGNGQDGTISVLLGDGTGNFTQGVTLTGGTDVLAVADFNGDGKLDMAVANGSSHTVSILLGDGMGDFTLASSPEAGKLPGAAAVGDFNGDGKLDLAVVNSTSRGTVSILLGDGTGNFTLASSIPTGDNPESIAVGDLNGDGNLDLAVANSGSNTVSILLGDDAGNFVLASSPETALGPYSVAMADFNGDGNLDLAVSNCGTFLSCGTNDGTVFILLGDGTGNFTLASSPATGGITSTVAVGDFNRDGKMDMVAENGSNSTVSILLQAPAVTLSPGILSFGKQLVGTTSPPQTVTATNVGYATVNISSITLDPTDFSESNDCPSNLPVGTSCTITVKFSPVTGGAIPATLFVSDDGGNNPPSVSITGFGLSAEVSPKSLDLGHVMVGQTSQPMVSTLTNIGSNNLDIYALYFVGKDPEDFSVGGTCYGFPKPPRHPVMIPPGGTCTIKVYFTPTQNGSRTATLNIDDNGGGPPIKVSGTGT